MADTMTTTKGPGLARGPALILGAILAAFGLLLFLKTGDTSTDGFPDGDATGPTFLGFETNGWTAWFTTAAGALLLFGAAQHLLAKTMSLIVGLALGACAIIAAIDGDVLGLAAANFWTELGWAIAAVLLLFNLFAPRVDHDRDDDVDRRDVDRRPATSRRRETVTTDRDVDSTTVAPTTTGTSSSTDGTADGSRTTGRPLGDTDTRDRPL